MSGNGPDAPIIIEEEAPDVEERPSSPWRAVVVAVVTGTTPVVTVLAFVLALLLGAVLIIVADADVRGRFGYFFDAPTDALAASWDAVAGAYRALFEGAVFDPDSLGGSVSDLFWPLSETVVTATPLIFTGLAVSLAFRAGMFNIGAEGQLVAGAILGAYVGFAFDLPPVAHVTVAVAAAVLGGAVWGLVPGLLKARTGAHEVIITIMLNYIAGFLLLYLLKTSVFQREGRADPISHAVGGDARLPRIAGEDLRLHAGFLLALGAAGLVAWLLSRSTLGFEFRAVGANPDAARTAGMSTTRVYVLVMMFAGALAGLAGASQTLATHHELTPGISANLGFDGITVALLGRATPWGTVLAGLLFGALRAGAPDMQANTGVSIEVVTVIQALVVIFIAAPTLIRELFRLRAARGGMRGEVLAKGWGG